MRAGSADVIAADSQARTLAPFAVGELSRSMEAQRIIERYRELQRYVGWTDADAERMRSARSCVAPHFAELVEDFYHNIEQHPNALKVITGGPDQIARLKGTLIKWLEQLFSGNYDTDYVVRRWKIGNRHVEIGLDQVYTNVALSRLRRGIMEVLERNWPGSAAELAEVRRAANTLIDLDQSLIEDAYQVEYLSRVQATERLALMGQVAGGVAHELRNSLNVIKTSVFYLLHARNASPEKVTTHLQRIERQIGLADDVISALVRFAKMRLPEIERFDVSALLLEQVAAMQGDCPSQVEIQCHCQDDLSPALADASQFRIVLDNLMRNAIEAMPNGGLIQVHARNSAPFVDIAVMDNGRGIERENLSRVMEPFYSTKAHGMGLGLAMAKAIVEKNGGRIRLLSELGKGTTFVVRLRSAAGR